MKKNKGCSYREISIHGNKAVIIENEKMRVGILTGKGCDVFELVYKPNNMDVLLRTIQGLDNFVERIFSDEKAKNYYEFYEGGWQDILPSRAIWGNCIVDEENSGEAATVAWNYSIVNDGEDELELKCTVNLPVMPLYVEKVFYINSYSSSLYVKEKVMNTSNKEVFFTWTQHPAFGRAFLEPSVEIVLPSEDMFDYKEFILNGVDNQCDYIHPFTRFPVKGSTFEDFSMLSEKNINKIGFFTIKDLKESKVTLRNRSKCIQLDMTWDIDTFPYLWYWLENTRDLYTLAIEPSTTYLPDLHNSLSKGMMINLQPNEARETWVNVSISDISFKNKGEITWLIN